MSRQKELIYSILQTSEGHLTASEVYSSARQILPNISLGTVYRDLSRLYEEERIGRFISTEGIAVYDFTPGSHAHIRCLRCGKITDLGSSDQVKQFFDSVPGTVVSANISIDYICSDCSD